MVRALASPHVNRASTYPLQAFFLFCHTSASLSDCLKPLAVSWEGSILPGFLKGQCTSSTEGNLYCKFNMEKNGSRSPYYATTSVGGGGICMDRTAFSLSYQPPNLVIISSLRMCTLSNIAKLHINCSQLAV